jgi:hypothetical protein
MDKQEQPRRRKQVPRLAAKSDTSRLDKLERITRRVMRRYDQKGYKLVEGWEIKATLFPQFKTLRAAIDASTGQPKRNAKTKSELPNG